MPPSILRRRMTFWLSHGLIIETSTGVYRLNEGEFYQKAHLSRMPIAEITEDDDQESAMASASDQREEELQVNFNKKFKRNCLDSNFIFLLF